MSFLDLAGKTFIVFGVANKRSVAYHIARRLESEDADVVYSVRSEERRDSLKGLLEDREVVLGVVGVDEPLERPLAEWAVAYDRRRHHADSEVLAEQIRRSLPCSGADE